MFSLVYLYTNLDSQNSMFYIPSRVTSKKKQIHKSCVSPLFFSAQAESFRQGLAETLLEAPTSPPEAYSLENSHVLLRTPLISGSRIFFWGEVTSLYCNLRWFLPDHGWYDFFKFVVIALRVAVVDMPEAAPSTTKYNGISQAPEHIKEGHKQK